MPGSQNRCSSYSALCEPGGILCVLPGGFRSQTDGNRSCAKAVLWPDFKAIAVDLGSGLFQTAHSLGLEQAQRIVIMRLFRMLTATRLRSCRSLPPGGNAGSVHQY